MLLSVSGGRGKPALLAWPGSDRVTRTPTGLQVPGDDADEPFVLSWRNVAGLFGTFVVSSGSAGA